jgi:hypothetical protein
VEGDAVSAPPTARIHSLRREDGSRCYELVLEFDSIEDAREAAIKIVVRPAVISVHAERTPAAPQQASA